MKRLFKHLDIVQDQLTNHDWDAAYAVVGDEGVSKSTLCLHITDYWYTKKNGVCTKEDAKHMCLDRVQFVTDLKDLKSYELTTYDEAGDIDSRSSMSLFNKDVRLAYQIIRGINLASILVLPSLWDLDTFFRNRRLRGLFVVYKRGRFAYYDRDRLRKIVALNENRLIKSYQVVRPTYYDTFPKYKGVLLEPYLKNKKTKMAGVLEELHSKTLVSGKKEETRSIKAEKCKAQRDNLLYNISESGHFPAKELAKLSGLSARSVRDILQQKRESGSSTEK